MPDVTPRQIARIWAGLGGLLLLHLAGLVWVWFHPATSTYFGALAAAVALAPFWGWAGFLWVRRPSVPPVPWPRMSLLGLAGAVGCALAIGIFGRRQLGGFDHSVLVDLGWRLVSGQRPYVDFPCTVPVGFMMGGKYAFELFGVAWTSLVAFQAVFSALTFLWCLALLRRLGANAGLAAGLALAVQAAADVVTSYWWYNPATTTIAAIFFLSAAAFWLTPRSVLIGSSYLFSLALLATMKPNIAGVLILGVTLALGCSPAHRWRMLGLSVAALGLFCGWLAWEGLSIHKVIRGYLSISSRGFTLHQFLQDLSRGEKAVSLLLLAMLMGPWLGYVVGMGRQAQNRLEAGSSLGVPIGLAVAAVLAGGYGFLTNGESKLVDLPLLLLSLWWLAGPLAAEGPPEPDRPFFFGLSYVGAATLVLVIFGLTVGLVRERVALIGSFFAPRLSAQPIPTPFFAGFQGSDQLQEIDAEVTDMLRRLEPKRVFFGPRMQWAYAAYGRPSPTGQPVWWHPGVAFPPGDEARYVQAWAADHLDVLVFLRDDYTYLPESFLAVLKRDYLLLPSLAYPQLSVYTRLPVAAPAAVHG